jgi:uncharacterized protein
MPLVARLNIAPVRSLGLESRDEVDLGPHGVAEDRRFYLVDGGGRLADQHLAGSMVQVKAWTDPDATRLRLTFPDGGIVDDTVRLTEPIQTPIYGRTGVGHIVEGPWGPALSSFLEKEVRLVRTDRIGGTRAKHPATLVTGASCDALGAALGVGAVDARRFRMLVELDGDEAHEEDTWVGRRIALGETILLVSGSVPRCAITTHDPDTGVRDLDTLRAIRTYRGLVDGTDLMFGVFGEVERAGRIRLGDAVVVLD